MSTPVVHKTAIRDHWGFWCPGCGGHHHFFTGAEHSPRWDWNGDPVRPTITPSLAVRWTEPSDAPEEFMDQSKDVPKVCHIFVTDGRIQYLPDCTHAMAGQTVEMADHLAPPLRV